MGIKLDELYIELKAVDTGLRTSLKEVSDQISQLNKKTDQEINGLNETLGRLKNTFIALGGIWGAIRIGRGFIDAGVQVQAMQNKMIAATGDAKVAADALAFTRAEANRLGLDIRTATDGFAGFSASALRAGLTLDQTKQIFTGVSEAAVSMRLSSESTALVFKALEQMAGKGTVQMEELKGQLGDSLPGAFEIAAKAMGKTPSEFTRMVSNGEVMAADFLPKFGAAIRKELGGSVEEASNSAQSAFNRLGNAWFDLQSKMADNGFLDAITTATKDMTATLNDPKVQEGLTNMAKLLGDVAQAALVAASAMGNFASSVSNAIEAAGDKTFGSLFGAEGSTEIANARKQKAARGSFESKMAADYATLGDRALQAYIEQQTGQSSGVSGNYTLNKANAPGESQAQRSARLKAERLREQMRGKVSSIDQANARKVDPQKQAALELAEQQKTLEKALDAKAITEEQYRQKSLEAEVAYQDRLTDIRQKATNLEVDMRDKALNNIQALLEVFAGKNKAVAMALLVFDKARAIAQAIMETHVAAAAALKYDPTGATSTYVTTLGYANVAAIAATGVAQLATMSMGGGGSGSSASVSGGSDVSASGSSSTAAASSGVSKSVYITLSGDSDALFSKNRVRQLIESINDAIGDGSQLKIAVS